MLLLRSNGLMGSGGWESRGMFRFSIHYALFEGLNIPSSGGEAKFQFGRLPTEWTQYIFEGSDVALCAGRSGLLRVFCFLLGYCNVWICLTCFKYCFPD